MNSVGAPSADAAPQAEVGRLNLAARIAIAGALLALEKSLLNLAVDFEAANAAPSAGAVLRMVQHFGLRFAVTFAVALGILAWVSADERLSRLNEATRNQPLRLLPLLLHVLAMLCTLFLLHSLYTPERPLPLPVQSALTLILASLGVLALMAAMVSFSGWRELASALGRRWLYAAVAAGIAILAFQLNESLWSYTAGVTFELVRYLLEPVIPGLHADPQTRILAGRHFSVHIADVCSGLEGIGLVLAFTLAWLAYFRREYRFPQALVLVPAGVLIIFGLNAVRIACLVLIGDAGHPDIAQFGFHSQAGWIAFNATACLIAVLSRRIGWLNTAAGADGSAAPGSAAAVENPTAAWVAPFLAVLLTGMVVRASSAGFETLDGLRVVAGAITLAWAWPRLRGIDWRMSWRGLVTGVLVFAIWITGVRLLHGLDFAAPPPEPLRSWPVAERLTWIFGRVLGSVAVIPVVEELAYRGFLLRRFVAADFDQVSFRSVGWWPLVVSSAIFAAGHGDMWAVAGLAGAAYGVLVMRSGRLGEAVLAHATTNALIAATVLAAGAWDLW